MARKPIKLVFNRDYSPRKKGDVVVFESAEELKTADWYLSNGIAHECSCIKDSETSGECRTCDDLAAKAKKKSPDLGQEDDKMNLEEAVAHIESLNTVEEIESFMVDEKRKGVKKAAESRISELTQD